MNVILKNAAAFLLGAAAVALPACALPGAPAGSPKGLPVAAAKSVLLGLAADVENFDADRDGLIRDGELSALGLQAALRLAAAAQPAPSPPTAQPAR